MMKNSSRIAALAMLAIGLAGAQNAQAADTYFKQTTVTGRSGPTRLRCQPRAFMFGVFPVDLQ